MSSEQLKTNFGQKVAQLERVLRRKGIDADEVLQEAGLNEYSQSDSESDRDYRSGEAQEATSSVVANASLGVVLEESEAEQSSSAENSSASGVDIFGREETFISEISDDGGMEAESDPPTGEDAIPQKASLDELSADVAVALAMNWDDALQGLKRRGFLPDGATAA